MISRTNEYFELIGTCYESCKRKKKKEREKKTDKEAINQSRGVTLDRSVSSYVEHTTLVYLPI